MFSPQSGAVIAWLYVLLRYHKAYDQTMTALVSENKPRRIAQPPVVKGRTSVIMPSYNRARFLPDAIASIRAQRVSDWELVIVDDGSTDDTAAVLEGLCRDIQDRVRYVRQENQGAYPARNTGLDLATGEFIAFFDSDDVWLPHHLEDCVGALAANPDVDWVYGACRMMNFTTGQELAPTTFYENGRPRPFLGLHADTRGRLRVLTDPATVPCAVTQGLYAGLQNSVIRQSVFADRRFRVEFHNEAEDQLFAIRAVLKGHRIGYLDNVHVVYRVHEANSSAANPEADVKKRLHVSLMLARGYEVLLREASLDTAGKRAVRQRLGREYFWHAGYVLLWQHGQRSEARDMYRKGLAAWPWSASSWKTYLICLLRSFRIK